MIHMKPKIIQISTAITMLVLIVFTGCGLVHADRDDLSTEVFFVT